MDTATFNEFAQLIYSMAGISLKTGKEALVSARLSKRMRALNIASHQEYLRYLKQDSSKEELIHLLDVISTNVTHFFREKPHFDFIGTEFERWLRSGQRRFRFWSAASSSGEEPYSLGMTLLEAMSGYDVDCRILATDISTRILQQAQAGLYSSEKVKNIPQALRSHHLSAERNEQSGLYRVNNTLRSMVVFKRLNLSQPPFPMQGPMDAVFCRNVMIYFDNPVRKRLLDEIYRMLKPGGYLFVGHAESLTGMVSSFKTVVPSIYKKA